MTVVSELIPMSTRKPLVSLFGVVMLALLAASLAGPAWSQGVVWRCGNEFTNQPGPNPEARGCRRVEGGNLSIVEGARAASGAAPAATGVTPSASAPAQRPAGAPTGARSEPERVDRAAQQARDRDARLILETELRRARERVAELEAEFNQGNPAPLASERGDEARYRERTAELERRLQRAQGDVAAIERELARLPAAR